MKKSNMFWQVYLNLEKEVLEISKYILFTDTTLKIDNKTKTPKIVDNNSHLEVYSPFIADLLVRCAVEIEAISKELYFENGGTKVRGDKDIYFDTDCLKLLNQKWNIADKVVVLSASNFNFTKDENLVLTPLNRADERSKAYWAKAYQAVKHDRYNSLHLGNVRALLQAMGALFLLNIYYNDIKFSSKYLEYRKLDMSFGSKIFTIKIPNDAYMVDVVNGKQITDTLHSTDSPYILKYTNASYKSIIDANEQYIQDLNDYWKAQPELKETEFALHLVACQEKEKENPQNRLIHLWELSKYRLNKKVPNTLPFEERKKLFVNASEWNGRTRKANVHRKEEELTEENLQAEIDSAAISAGIDLQQRFENNRLFKAFNDGQCELILDKGNVKYEV